MWQNQEFESLSQLKAQDNLKPCFLMLQDHQTTKNSTSFCLLQFAVLGALMRSVCLVYGVEILRGERASWVSREMVEARRRKWKHLGKGERQFWWSKWRGRGEGCCCVSNLGWGGSKEWDVLEFDCVVRVTSVLVREMARSKPLELTLELRCHFLDSLDVFLWHTISTFLYFNL